MEKAKKIGDTAISTQHVTKHFKIYYDKGQTAKERLLFRRRTRYEERVVLRNVNVEIKRGESVGLIGENGSGKSTLLKILSRIMYPNSGDVKVNGRVSSLLELGAGFHPDMSGRENIYTNATIFGLSRAEIDRRLDRIIAYSELEQFIDNPVRTYSSGMYMRLAFSVAINVDADILLIDEILAVGDANFQRKCFNTLRQIKSSGTTILIVSHSLGQIEQFCDRSIWLDNGIIRLDGEPRSVHAQYLEFMDNRVLQKSVHQPDQAEQTRQSQDMEESQHPAPDTNDPIPDNEDSQDGKDHESENQEPNAPEKLRFGNKDYVITGIKLTDGDGVPRTVFKSGEPLHIEIRYQCKGQISNDAIVGIGIFRNDGIHCYGSNTFIDHGHPITLSEKGSIIFDAPQCLLLNGEYWLDVAIESSSGFPYDYWRQAVSFQMISGLEDIGVARVEHGWLLNGERIK